MFSGLQVSFSLCFYLEGTVKSLFLSPGTKWNSNGSQGLMFLQMSPEKNKEEGGGEDWHFSPTHRHLWTITLGLFLIVSPSSTKHQLKISIFFLQRGVWLANILVCFSWKGWGQTLLPGGSLPSQAFTGTVGTAELAGHTHVPTHVAQGGVQKDTHLHVKLCNHIGRTDPVQPQSCNLISICKNPLRHKASNDTNGTQHGDTVQACGNNHRPRTQNDWFFPIQHMFYLDVCIFPPFSVSQAYLFLVEHRQISLIPECYVKSHLSEKEKMDSLEYKQAILWNSHIPNNSQNLTPVHLVTEQAKYIWTLFSPRF